MNKKYNLTIPLEFDPEIWKPQELMQVIYNIIVDKHYNELPSECKLTFTDGISFKIYKPKLEELCFEIKPITVERLNAISIEQWEKWAEKYKIEIHAYGFEICEPLTYNEHNPYYQCFVGNRVIHKGDAKLLRNIKSKYFLYQQLKFNDQKLRLHKNADFDLNNDIYWVDTLNNIIDRFNLSNCKLGAFDLLARAKAINDLVWELETI